MLSPMNTAHFPPSQKSPAKQLSNTLLIEVLKMTHLNSQLILMKLNSIEKMRNTKQIN